MDTENTGKSIKAVTTFAQDAASLGTRKVQGGMVVPQKSPNASEAQTTTPQKPFAELAEVAQKITVPVESVLSDLNNAQDGSHEDGRIIRDTKRKRFRLIPAVIQATTEWFEGQKTTYDTYRHPYHPIENADARKDVIQAAVSKSSIAPKEDFHVVAERLKETPRTVVKTGITLKDKTETPKPQWSSVADAEVKEVTETIPEVTNAPQSSLPPVVDTAVQQTVTQSPQSVQKPSETPVYSQKTQAVPIPPKPEPVIEQTPTEDKEVPTAVPQSPVIAIPTPQQTVPQQTPVPQESVLPRSTEKISRKEPSAFVAAFTRYALLGVVVLSIISGVAVSFILFSNKSEVPEQKVAVHTIPSFVQATQQPVLLPQDRGTLLIELQRILQQNVGVVELYPTLSVTDGSQIPASSEQILNTLALRTAGSFNRSIVQMSFGGASTDPFIVMKTTNFDVAFAGMLGWEQSMSADLSPLFGTPVVATFDPSARTDTQVRDAFFKDVIASNKNVRLLLDEDGNDRIVYTFIDQNTILITTTREALDTLIPLMK